MIVLTNASVKQMLRYIILEVKALFDKWRKKEEEEKGDS